MFSSKIKAKVVGDALIINLQTSVWRCALSELSHALFTIKTRGKKHSLFLKISNREENIASFDNKEDAEQALKIVTKALLTPIATTKKKSWFKRIFYILLFLFILYVIAWVAVPKILEQTMLSDMQATSQQSAGKQGYVTPKNMTKGVPMSADEMFGD